MLAPTMRDIIQTEYFRVVVVDDEDAVEICGALKVDSYLWFPCVVSDLELYLSYLGGCRMKRLR